jgi:hypothetical protein
MSSLPARLEAATQFRLRSRRIASTRNGYDAQSSYVEQFWLPVLGPSTTWLIRHLNSRLDRDGEGVIVEASATAQALGLGQRSGRHTPFLRSIRRAIDYDLVTIGECDGACPEKELLLLVRRLVPPLSDRLADRLPAETLARERHRFDDGSHADETPLARQARQLPRTQQRLEAQYSDAGTDRAIH